MDEQQPDSLHQSPTPHDPISWLKYMNSQDQGTKGPPAAQSSASSNQPDNIPQQEDPTHPITRQHPLNTSSSIAHQQTQPSPSTANQTANAPTNSTPTPSQAQTSSTTPGAPTSPLTQQQQPIQPAAAHNAQNRTIMWIALAALILVALYTFLQFNTFLSSALLPFWPTTFHHNNPADTNNTPPNPTVKNLQLAPHTLVIIDGHNSNITVSSGTTATMTITVRNHNTNFGPDDATTIHYDQSINAQGIAQLHISTDPAYKDIDYDITAPSTTILQINTDSGSVSINGISAATIHTANGGLDLANIQGPVNATTDSGDINAHDLKGTTTLQTSNGSIHLTSITGLVNATTQSGDVIASQVSLNGHSTLRTTNGSVRVNGTLDPHGTYTMATDSGDVDLTLPANSAFSLTASTSSGSVHNDFNNTTIGNAPRATITINVGNGSINIDRNP